MAKAPRTLVAAIGMATLALGRAEASAAVGYPAFVLVHGAWMGPAAWDRVANDLRQRGGEVVQVELPAHGKDATPADKASMDGYVDAVVKAIGDRTNVVLVGHSFGGIVISAVAERVPERIGRLVYVAAYLPRDGESCYSLSQLDRDSHVGRYWTQADPARYTPVTLRREGLIDVFCADCDAQAQQFVLDTHREEPLAPMAAPIKLTADRFGRIPRFYIATRQDHAVSYPLQQLMLGNTPAKSVVTLDASHAVMLSRPGEVAKALRGFARQ